MEQPILTEKRLVTLGEVQNRSEDCTYLQVIKLPYKIVVKIELD